MKLKRMNPCNECPFRQKAAKGWLGPWTIDSILQQVHGEAGLACHKSVATILKKNPNDEELIRDSHVCVGSIQHATISCKSYRNPVLAGFQDKLGKGLGIMHFADFIKHHTIEKIKKVK